MGKTLEGLANGKRTKERRRDEMTDDIRMRYREMKRLAQYRTVCPVG